MDSGATVWALGVNGYGGGGQDGPSLPFPPVFISLQQNASSY